MWAYGPEQTDLEKDKLSSLQNVTKCLEYRERSYTLEAMLSDDPLIIDLEANSHFIDSIASKSNDNVALSPVQR